MRVFHYHLGLMVTQYGLNIFIYAYRSKEYRAAYWDFLVKIFPCLPKLKADLGKRCGKKDSNEDFEMEQGYKQCPTSSDMPGSSRDVDHSTRMTVIKSST